MLDLNKFFVTLIAILFLPWARVRGPLLSLLFEKSLLASAPSFERPLPTPRYEEIKKKYLSFDAFQPVYYLQISGTIQNAARLLGLRQIC